MDLYWGLAGIENGWIYWGLFGNWHMTELRPSLNTRQTALCMHLLYRWFELQDSKNINILKIINLAGFGLPKCGLFARLCLLSIAKWPMGAFIHLVSAAQVLHHLVVNGRLAWHAADMAEAKVGCAFACIAFLLQKGSGFASPALVALSFFFFSCLHNLGAAQLSLPQLKPRSNTRSLPSNMDHSSPNGAGHERRWKHRREVWLMCA